MKYFWANASRVVTRGKDIRIIRIRDCVIFLFYHIDMLNKKLKNKTDSIKKSDLNSSSIEIETVLNSNERNSNILQFK